LINQSEAFVSGIVEHHDKNAKNGI